MFPVIGLVELGALGVAGGFKTVLIPEVGRTKLGALTEAGPLISVIAGALGWFEVGALTVVGAWTSDVFPSRLACRASISAWTRHSPHWLHGTKLHLTSNGPV